MIKSPRPTHVRVIVMPKAQKIAVEGCAPDATGTVFEVEQAAEIYQMMLQAGKKTKLPLKIWVAEQGAKTPEVKFNKYDNKPYMALVGENKAPGKVTKVVF
jgi:hypothetical protein